MTGSNNMADWKSGLAYVPAHMHGAVERYMINGINPGSFLYAVMANDFKGAVGRADDVNFRYLKEWANFVYWEVPCDAQGSHEKVQAWMARGGMNGIQAAAAAQNIEAEDASADLHD